MNPSNPSANMKFSDRRAAGRELAKLLDRHRGQPDLLVLGLPPGGVPVAFEIAQALRATFDVFMVRKLRVPNNPDLVMGAITAGGLRVLNRNVVDSLALSEAVIADATQLELKELTRQEAFFRETRRASEIAARNVIVVDDGVETGVTMRAALKALRVRGARRVILATPIAALEAAAQLRVEADSLVAAVATDDFKRLGYWYKELPPVTESEIRDLLADGRLFGGRTPTLAPFASSTSRPPVRLTPPRSTNGPWQGR